MNRNKTSAENTGFWVLVWSLGIAGQLCWNIENQWFNTFVYAKIAKDSNIITLMVITSALVTTFATFFFGTVSDRTGTRRKYISIGYITWGIFTILFGMTELITNGAVGIKSKLNIVAAVVVIFADDVMSFFGSMGNDSGYNAWINDMTTNKNRGQLGAALAIQPIIGTIAGTVLGGLLIGNNNNYQRLFWAMGLFVISVGVISLFFLKDSRDLKPNRKTTFSKQFYSIFNLKNFFSRKELVQTCLAVTIYFIAFNIYFIHLGNWMIYRMGFTPVNMGLVQGIGLIFAMLFVIPGIKLINKQRTPYAGAIALILNITGLCILYFFVSPETVDVDNLFSPANSFLFLGVFLAGSGHILITQASLMWVKQLFPKDSRGQFEGIRILFFVLIPMIIGTNIGNLIIKRSSGTVVNEFGILENIPTESIFIWAAVVVIFAFIPLYLAGQNFFKRINESKEIGSYPE